MEQTVRVREVYPDGTALVTCSRVSACSGDCHQCRGCGAAPETIELRAVNAIGACAGDWVRLQSDSRGVLRGAAVLYSLPVALFFAGFALGAALHASGAAVGGLGFAAGLLGAAIYDRRLAKKETVYTITAFADSDRRGG